MDIMSYNPGHDGAVALLRDRRLVSSVEAEKDSNWRYSPLSGRDVVDAFGRLDQVPDVVCTGGWRPAEARPTGSPFHVGYRGVAKDEITVDRRSLIGKSVPFFSSSHERSHLLCGFGMSPFPQGSSCYALVWEGAIGAFYEIDPDMNITLIADVMNEPGNRYASVYGLADPAFPKNAPFSRFSDAGKLMALASFARRKTPTAEEEELMTFLLSSEHVRLDLYERLESSVYYNVGSAPRSAWVERFGFGTRPGVGRWLGEQAWGPEAEPCLKPPRQCGDGDPAKPCAASQSVVMVTKGTAD